MSAHPENSTAAAWYAVFTKPRQEARACENLARQGFTYFFPTQVRETLQQGKKSERIEALFPRYLFVRLEEGVSNWSLIRSTRGVLRLVEFGGKAAKVPDQLIEFLSTQAAPRHDLFAIGEQLKISSGPFAGLLAEVQSLIEAPNGEMRVMVLLELLSKPQKLIFPANILHKTA